MSNAGVGVKDLVHVGLVLLDELLQLVDLADLLEGEDFTAAVAVDGQTRGVIATVFETLEA